MKTVFSSRTWLRERLGSLGLVVHAHPYRVVALWAMATMLASLAAVRVEDALTAGAGDLGAGNHQTVERTLREEFTASSTRALYLGIMSSQWTVEDGQFLDWIATARETLLSLPEVERIDCYLDDASARFRSATGDTTILLVGLSASTVEEEEASVADIRVALAVLHAEILAADPAARFAVTGHAAITWDLNLAGKVAGQQAEARALPLTFLILVLAFGALVAAGIPLVVGLVSTSVALGLAWCLTSVMPLSNSLPNVVTMLGLAVGIDYSLLMVTHFRDECARSASPQDFRGLLEEAGLAVLVSGSTVVLGLSGLLFTPLMELRSIGLGGSMVVAVAVLAALTLVPALLVILGSHIDFPRVLSRRLHHAGANRRWEQLAKWVLQHPVVTISVGCVIVCALGAPAFQARGGFDSSKYFLPRGLESREGIELLERLGSPNVLWPIDILVQTTDGSGVLEPTNLKQLLSLAEALESDDRIADVISPVTLREDLGPLQYALLYASVDSALERYPRIGELLLSKDRTTALFQCVTSQDTRLTAAGELASELEATELAGPLEVLVGGLPVYYRNLDQILLSSFPRSVAFVVLSTMLLLFVTFRSILIPIKAVVMNLLSVFAGFGAVVAVFQLGYLSSFIGLERPLDSIPLTIPVILFFVTFGISMDYEVFMLSRMKRVFDQTGDNRTAIVAGVSGTGPLITNAAAVMVVIFGAFVMADAVIVQMLGLGLAVAVLVDATVIRILLVPAWMAVAGRWNWYPGAR